MVTISNSESNKASLYVHQNGQMKVKALFFKGNKDIFKKQWERNQISKELQIIWIKHKDENTQHLCADAIRTLIQAHAAAKAFEKEIIVNFGGNLTQMSARLNLNGQNWNMHGKMLINFESIGANSKVKDCNLSDPNNIYTVDIANISLPSGLKLSNPKFYIILTTIKLPYN